MSQDTWKYKGQTTKSPERQENWVNALTDAHRKGLNEAFDVFARIGMSKAGSSGVYAMPSGISPKEMATYIVQSGFMSPQEMDQLVFAPSVPSKIAIDGKVRDLTEEEKADPTKLFDEDFRFIGLGVESKTHSYVIDARGVSTELADKLTSQESLISLSRWRNTLNTTSDIPSLSAAAESAQSEKGSGVG